MPRDLETDQLDLINALREGRVPSGFDERGVKATAGILVGKQRRAAADERRRVTQDYVRIPVLGIRILRWRLLLRRVTWR
jgi:hypothetical protein